ncbi:MULTISPECIES: hypothetical protein [unclassified Polynucleobacter]|jgi:hypothetical protein|uniref:hypothetical protein n=1 Tax=unclassified Polynucleobacter TaxID=2640945 RepID=UPI0025723355|nr:MULTISPECIES: hypothetical protein [unclassified Polynucleobacter]BEI35070.1 hypothetical protein PHIN6_05880 [Polynucleobacter sp. HIN6]BEI36901.1 hypothetical protein PHIN7_06250 [Polynucleobacter sp. HIN7]BEI40676.1 hypothetical protein PHIN9_06070 [Polynucleobacter sp. HIN9]
MKRLLVGSVCLIGSTVALAALPPPTPQQAEAAALAKAKTAYAGTVASYQLCQSINAIAMKYKTAGTPNPAPCVAPPPFVPPATASVAPAPAPAKK